MLEFSIDVSGIERAAHEAARELDGAIVDGIEAGLEPVAENARATTAFHDRTGRLRASIQAVDDVRETAFGASGFVTADAGHALFLEGGTKHVAPRPFLAPAIEQELGRATDAMVGKLDDMLERSGF
ncbi:MAG: hypothetical protein IT379_39445 [Deltaproteobacteria bacterium]|nr:hypothetical protein [Deltaproteobacteria bacterium]